MRIEANGIEIGYDIAGEGPWLVLSHALGLNRSMWFRQLPDLARRRRVLTWDARGHGESSKPPGPYSFDLMARDLAGLLDALGVERTAVLGLSMGGNIGIAFAAAHPQRTSALILCDTTAWYGSEAEQGWRDRIAAVERAGIEPLIPVQAERWFTEGFRSSHPEVVQRVLDLLRAADQQGYVAVLEALARLDQRDSLAAIRCPTLIVVGREDVTTPPDMAEQLHRAIPGSQLLVLDRARHLAPIEQADAFNQAVLRFLDQVGA
ncbi:MAG: alpha/beta fold hydrolase [Sphingomonadaceae bacterium]